MLMNQANYAAHRKAHRLPGGTREAVSQAVQTGRIPVFGDGMIDPAVADAAWAKNTRANPHADATKAEAAAQPAQQPTRQREAAEGPRPGTISHATLVLETAKAQEAGLRVQRLQGMTLQKRDVEQTWSQVLSGLRSRLLLVADDVAARVAASRDALECRDIVDQSIREALTALSDFPAQYAA
jgi:hypothetical protein